MKIRATVLVFACISWQTVAAIRGEKKSTIYRLPPITEGRDLEGELQGYGGEPADYHFPLQLCEGDCDYDYHVSHFRPGIDLNSKL